MLKDIGKVTRKKRQNRETKSSNRLKNADVNEPEDDVSANHAENTLKTGMYLHATTSTIVN